MASPILFPDSFALFRYDVMFLELGGSPKISIKEGILSSAPLPAPVTAYNHISSFGQSPLPKSDGVIYEQPLISFAINI